MCHESRTITVVGSIPVWHMSRLKKYGGLKWWKSCFSSTHDVYLRKDLHKYNMQQIYIKHLHIEFIFTCTTKTAVFFFFKFSTLVVIVMNSNWTNFRVSRTTSIAPPPVQKFKEGQERGRGGRRGAGVRRGAGIRRGAGRAGEGRDGESCCCFRAWPLYCCLQLYLGAKPRRGKAPIVSVSFLIIIIIILLLLLPPMDVYGSPMNRT